MATVMEMLITDGRFNTFVSAIQAANLTETFAKPGPFTVFAPTEDAFMMMPEGETDTMMRDIPALTRFVLYHVIGSKLSAAEIVGQESLTTLEGAPVQIQNMGGKVYVNDAQILQSDLMADNGVIHTLDMGLLPPRT